MGVDISGRNPIARGAKPEINWDDATEQEKDKYFRLDNTWRQENPGNAFRANWWSWRPLHALIEEATIQSNLAIDTSLWGSNSGAGLDSSDNCISLANALESLLQTMPELTEDDDRLYFVLNSWVDIHGRFLSPEWAEEHAAALPTTGSTMYTAFILEDGSVAASAHSISLGHIKGFTSFLRECGGFQIW